MPFSFRTAAATEHARGEHQHRRIPFSIVTSALRIVLVVVMALLANQIVPYPYTAPDLPNRLASPFHPQHLFGTDKLGRDVFVTIGLLGSHFRSGRSWVQR